MKNETIKILYVCHGNICRSPMAEFVMKKLVADADAEDRFYIESAATSTEEIGSGVYPPVKKLLSNAGIDCSKKHARQITKADLDKFDYIVLMDSNNLRNLRWMFDGISLSTDNKTGLPGKVSLLKQWSDEIDGTDVADPWYTRDFDLTWREVNIGCKAMLEKLL